MDFSREKDFYRKRLGVFLILIEMNLLGGTIFGFPAIFKVLSKYGIYQNLCQSPVTDQCFEKIQIKQYQVMFSEIYFYCNYICILFEECNDIRNCFF